MLVVMFKLQTLCLCVSFSQLWSFAVGAVDGRGAISWHWLYGGSLWCGHEQTVPADPLHLSWAICPADGRHESHIQQLYCNLLT